MNRVERIKHYLQAVPLEKIDEILLNGVRHSFLEVEQKQQMEQTFRAEMKQLHDELGLSKLRSQGETFL
jgi:hypothetical protein